MITSMDLSATDVEHLRRCVELAEIALDDGDEPFGSVLVDVNNRVLFEDRNRVAGGDRTRHPEFEIARWAAANLTVDDIAPAIPVRGPATELEPTMRDLHHRRFAGQP